MCLLFIFGTHQRVCVLNFLKERQIRCILMYKFVQCTLYIYSSWLTILTLLSLCTSRLNGCAQWYTLYTLFNNKPCMRSWLLCLVLLMHEWQSSEKMGQRAWPTGILAPPTSASHFTEFVLYKGVGTLVHQDHKVHIQYIHKEYHSVCPASECAPPPRTEGGREGAHSPAG